MKTKHYARATPFSLPATPMSPTVLPFHRSSSFLERMTYPLLALDLRVRTKMSLYYAYTYHSRVNCIVI